MGIESGPQGSQEALESAERGHGGRSIDTIEPKCLLDVLLDFEDGDAEAEIILTDKLKRASGKTALVGCDVCRSKFTFVKGGYVRPWPPGCQKTEVDS